MLTHNPHDEHILPVSGAVNTKSFNKLLRLLQSTYMKFAHVNHIYVKRVYLWVAWREKDARHLQS